VTDGWRVTPAVPIDSAPWFKVHQVQVTDPAGGQRSRSYLHTPQVVILVAEHDGSLLFVREFRAAVGDRVLSLPIGKVDPGSTPEQAAATELAEETGHVADRLALAGELLTAPGWMDQRTSVFHATGLRPVERPVGADADDVEEQFMEVERIPLAEVADRIRSGEITDARTIAAIALVLGLAAPGQR
jgi:ADP-ribose pyrophosphatase